MTIAVEIAKDNRICCSDDEYTFCSDKHELDYAEYLQTGPDVLEDDR
jgi:hypothetical protein